MSAEDIVLWGAVLILGFIAGAAIYIEAASFRKSESLRAVALDARGPASRKQNSKARAKGKTS